MPELYPFQQYTVDRFKEIRSVLIGDEVGTGKSAQAIALDLVRREFGFKDGKTLVITPLAVTTSWIKQFKMWAPQLAVIKINNRNRNEFLEALDLDTHDVYICHWESLRLMPELREKKWFHIVADECLVANTKIDTPSGKKNIEDIIVGDIVYGFDHGKDKVVKTTVKNTFKNTLNSKLYAVSNVLMTGNHPVWTEEYGYVDASRLDSMKYTVLRLQDEDLRRMSKRIHAQKADSTILQSKMLDNQHNKDSGKQKNSSNINDNMRVVRARVSGTKVPKRRSSVLRKVMFKYLERSSLPQSSSKKDHRKWNAILERKWKKATTESQATRIRKLRTESIQRPKEVIRDSPKGSNSYKRKRIYSLKWWDGKTFHTSTNAGPTSRVENRSSNSNKSWERPSLYDRHSRDYIKGSSRSRRTKSLNEFKKEDRRRKRQIFNVYGLEGTSLHKQRGDEEPRTLCTESSKVYNIETESGNYFANGILLHNCHKIQNRKTKVSVNLKLIPTAFKTGLSGTPAYDKPDDLWSVLNWLYPRFWTSYWRYFDRYVLWVDYNGYKQVIGVANQEELQEQMRGFYIRRKKEDVIQDLPEKTFTQMFVDLTPKQRRAYNQMRDSMISWVGENEDKPVNATAVVSQLIRLQQFASAHAEINDEGKMILSDPSSKIDAAIEILYSTNKQIVFFSQFTQIINLFCERLKKNKITFGKFTGETSAKERSKTVDGFMSGELRVFAGNVAAGGTGLDGLQVTDIMVFFDRPWSHSVFDQAVGRLDRIGQKNNIQIIDLIATGTIEKKRIEKITMEWKWIRELLGEDDE